MFKRWALLLIVLLFLAGCSGRSGETFVWIDVPLNPTYLGDVTPVTIVGHASSPEGVAQVEVWVNGTMVETISNPMGDGNLAQFESSFTPTGPGEYTIQVVATGANGVISDPDNAVVTIGQQIALQTQPSDELPTPTDTPTPPPTNTPTPVPDADEPVVNYWADPETIEAGGCTTIYWDVLNVSRVEFGGQDQAFQGSYHDCMCETQTYPLTVTYTDGTRETYRVTINVTGVCEPDDPTPPPDAVGPAEPTLLKPVNGYEFSCIPSLMLRWSAPSDPSGISEYRVQVERQPGDDNWQPVAGSVFTGISVLEKELTVECGFMYRFRVRAIDGVGNLGDFSDWWYFTIKLN